MESQLFITQFDETYLPEEFHLSHNLTVRLYDDLVLLLKEESIQRRASVKLPKKAIGVEYSQLQQFLNDNGYQDTAKSLVVNDTIMAVVADICHFIYESLNCAKAIKLTVAYSLVRKPFLENLVVLEKIFTDENRFLSDFKQDSSKYDPGRLKDGDRRELIKACFDKLDNIPLDKELIYKLRFDKDYPASIYSFGNLATHLVTTRHPKFKTNNSHFNLIFSDHESWHGQLTIFYTFLPYLLYYTTQLVYQLFLEKKFISKKVYNRTSFFRFFIHLLLMERVSGNKQKLIIGLTKKMQPKCDMCGRVNRIFKSDIYQLVHDHSLVCKFCLSELLIDGSLTDKMINRFIEYVLKRKKLVQ